MYFNNHAVYVNLVNLCVCYNVILSLSISLINLMKVPLFCHMNFILSFSLCLLSSLSFLFFLFCLIIIFLFLFLLSFFSLSLSFLILFLWLSLSFFVSLCLSSSQAVSLLILFFPSFSLSHVSPSKLFILHFLTDLFLKVGIGRVRCIAKRWRAEES